MTAATKGVKLWNQLIFHPTPLKNPERQSGAFWNPG